MAEKASADRVAADMQPPNYRAAVQIIRHTIQKKKEKIAEVNGQIGEQWGKVEGFKVNKKAGRVFAMLDKLEHEERVEIMRSLNGLIDGVGWEETAGDLVDAAENNVVHLRVGAGQNQAADEGNGEAGEDDGGDEAEMAEVEAAIAEPAKPRRGRKPKDPEQADAESSVAKSAAEAREKVKKHFGQPSGTPAPEPYTGDNTDLAGE